jgi:hypothetical protein
VSGVEDGTRDEVGPDDLDERQDRGGTLWSGDEAGHPCLNAAMVAPSPVLRLAVRRA